MRVVPSLACTVLCFALAACRGAAPPETAAQAATPAVAGSGAASAPTAAAEAQRASTARKGAAAGVHALTGARARVVWVQGDGTDPYAAGHSLVLMGLDTEDGKGERVILGERGSYVKPLLISNGRRILYT